jgi:hypothetical protein
MPTSSQPALGSSNASSKSALAALLLAAIKNAQTTAKPDAPVVRIAQDSANPSVAHCCQAYNDAMQAARAQGESQYGSTQAAERAYRNAMPPLSGADNIRDFIACVAHGMLLEAIKGSDSARLLYATQIAYGAVEKPTPRQPGRPASKLIF